MTRISNQVFEANAAGKDKWFQKDLTRDHKPRRTIDNQPTEVQIIERLRKVEQKDQYMMFELLTAKMSFEDQQRIMRAV